MTQEDKPKIKALIVGVNNYIASDSLKYAVQDASSVNESLKKLYDGIDTILLTDGLEPRYQPIRSNILSNVKLISENAQTNENILFYFAGHGKDIDGEPVILPSDYRDEVGIGTAIKIEEIKTSFVNARAKFKLMILDSCHSGAAKGRAESGRMSNSTFKALDELPEGFAVVSACRLDQISYEDETLHHGVFTHFLLEGIDGKADSNNDKVVTINELYDYLVPNVKEWVFKRFNASQIPHFRTNVGGVYVLSRLPVDSPKTEDTLGTELFSGMYLWQDTHDMELLRFNAEGMDPAIDSKLEKSVEEIILVLRKEYGIKGLKDVGKSIDFPDGSVLRRTEEDEKRNEMRFRIGVYFDYKKERWSKIDGLLLELDDMVRTWEKIVFMTPRKFDFAAIEELCSKHGYDIVGLKLRDPKTLSFTTKAFSDAEHTVHVEEFEDYSTVSIESTESQFLRSHFYALINPRKVVDILGSSVLA